MEPLVSPNSKTMVYKILQESLEANICKMFKSSCKSANLWVDRLTGSGKAEGK